MLTASLGIPLKQELDSESSSSYGEPGLSGLDFTLFDPESLPELIAGFDNNPLDAYAPVPWGHAYQDHTSFPL